MIKIFLNRKNLLLVFVVIFTLLVGLSISMNSVYADPTSTPIPFPTDYQKCGSSGCDGGGCSQDWQCNSGSCKNGKCASGVNSGSGGGVPNNCRQVCTTETYCEGCWTSCGEWGWRCSMQGSPPEEVCSNYCKRESGWKQCCTPNQTRQVCSQVCDPPPPACDVNNWGGWSTCTKTCGGGAQSRTNACGTSQSQACNTQACVVVPTTVPPTVVAPTVTPIPPTSTPIPVACVRKAQGDANCDGAIDGIDYSIWLNTQCRPAAGQTCADTRADFNKDGNTDDSDYQIWFANRGT